MPSGLVMVSDDFRGSLGFLSNPTYAGLLSDGGKRKDQTPLAHGPRWLTRWLAPDRRLAEASGKIRTCQSENVSGDTASVSAHGRAAFCADTEGGVWRNARATPPKSSAGSLG